MTKSISLLLLIVVAATLSGCLPFGQPAEQKTVQPAINQNMAQPANQAATQPDPAPIEGQNSAEPVVLVDLTEDWLTNFQPLSMPISYRYPKDWSIGKKGDLNTGSVSGPKNNPVFEVTEERELAGLSPKEAAAKDGSFSSVSSQQESVIDGKTAYAVTGQTVSADQVLGLEKIYIAEAGKIYSVKFLDWNQGDIISSPYYQTYQDILISLTFTK